MQCTFLSFFLLISCSNDYSTPDASKNLDLVDNITTRFNNSMNCPLPDCDILWDIEAIPVDDVISVTGDGDYCANFILNFNGVSGDCEVLTNSLFRIIINGNGAINSINTNTTLFDIKPVPGDLAINSVYTGFLETTQAISAFDVLIDGVFLFEDLENTNVEYILRFQTGFFEDVEVCLEFLFDCPDGTQDTLTDCTTISYNCI